MSVWHPPAPGRLLIAPLDLTTAVYDRASGQTHVLTPPLPELLVVLDGGPADTAAIVARLAARYDVADGDAAEALITERLRELAALGLIERR